MKFSGCFSHGNKVFKVNIEVLSPCCPDPPPIGQSHLVLSDSAQQILTDLDRMQILSDIFMSFVWDVLNMTNIFPIVFY